MSRNPLVSVVIASYNMAHYLPLAVQSVLDQSYFEIEVLIVDDGSTDNTRSVLKPFLEDARIRYFWQENRGQAVAKNRGVRESRGDYIAFLDADDLWVRDKLEAQLPLFRESPAIGVVYSAYAYLDANGNVLHDVPLSLHRGRVTAHVFLFNFVGFGTSVVKRECFEHMGVFDEELGMGIDYDLWLRFSTQYEFDYVDRPLLYYREWGGQMSKSWNTRYVNCIQIMKSFLRDFPHALDEDTVNEAWAHTYTGYAYCMRTIGKRPVAALRLYLQALRYKPGYFTAWKGIAASMLGR